LQVIVGKTHEHILPYSENAWLGLESEFRTF
jgi:hypothetical protein